MRVYIMRNKVNVRWYCILLTYHLFSSLDIYMFASIVSLSEKLGLKEDRVQSNNETRQIKARL